MAEQVQCPNCHQYINADNQSAVRLLGFALFNLHKGNSRAALTLMRKAYKALTGREWDG
jgi:hypothetical protein